MADERTLKPGQLRFAVHIPFGEALGLELWAFGDGKAELRLDLKPAHCNSWAVAHGGVLMTMLDVTMAHAARSGNVQAADASAGHGPAMATIEMKTSFLRPAEGRLRATGTLLHKTSTLAFTESSVFNAAGQLCAHATGTFKYLRALPTSARQAKPLQHNPTDKDSP